WFVARPPALRRRGQERHPGGGGQAPDRGRDQWGGPPPVGRDRDPWVIADIHDFKGLGGRCALDRLLKRRATQLRPGPRLGRDAPGQRSWESAWWYSSIAARPGEDFGWETERVNPCGR